VGKRTIKKESKMKLGTIVAIVGVIIAVISALTLLSLKPVTIAIMAGGVALYLLGKKLNIKK
jgi:uncharacterized membrane protein